MMTDFAKPSNNPKSIRQIQAEKKRLRDSDNNKLRIYNKSKLQPVSIQLYGKNSNLVMHQQTIYIAAGKHADLPYNRLIKEQIDNLKKRGYIRTVRVGSLDGSMKKLSDAVVGDALSQIPKHISKRPVSNNAKNRLANKEELDKKIKGEEG